MARSPRSYRRVFGVVVLVIMCVLVSSTVLAIDRWMTTRAVRRSANTLERRTTELKVAVADLEVLSKEPTLRAIDYRDHVLPKVRDEAASLNTAASDARRAVVVLSAFRSASSKTHLTTTHAGAGGGAWGATSCTGKTETFSVKPGSWEYNLQCKNRLPAVDVSISIEVTATAVPSELTSQVELGSKFFCVEDTWNVDSVKRVEEEGTYGGTARCNPQTDPLTWQLTVTCPVTAERCLGTYMVTVEKRREE